MLSVAQIECCLGLQDVSLVIGIEVYWLQIYVSGSPVQHHRQRIVSPRCRQASKWLVQPVSIQTHALLFSGRRGRAACTKRRRCLSLEINSLKWPGLKVVTGASSFVVHGLIWASSMDEPSLLQSRRHLSISLTFHLRRELVYQIRRVSSIHMNP